MKRKLLLLSMLVAGSMAANAQWSEQSSNFTAASRGINDFDVVDSNIVWAVAYDGSGGAAIIRDFATTKSGGGTWTPKSLVATGLNATYGLANISAVDADTAYASVYPGAAATAAQGVYKTTDGGTTWAKVTAGKFVGAASFINVVHMFDAQNGVALGDPEGGYFEAYTTSNYGNTWTRVPQMNIPFAPVTAAEYGTVGYFGAKDSSIWYSTNFGRVLVSHDLGMNWALGTTPYDSTASMAIPSYSFESKMNGYAVITDGTVGNVDAIIKTTDGGLTWDTLTTGTTGEVYSRNGIAFVPGTIGTIFVSSANATDGGMGTAYSEDFGATWVNIDKVQHTCIAFSDINNGWSGDFNDLIAGGGIFKWGNLKDPEPTTGVAAAKNSNALNVYPNPSSDLIYVNAKVEGASAIRVIDMTGKVVFAKEYNTASLLYTSIDLNAFAKGLYVVEVTSNGKASAKRISVE